MKEIPYLAKALAQVVREAREEKGLTQQELSDRMGCARPFLAAMETEKYKLSLNAFLVTCRCLGIPSQEMLDRLEKRLKYLEYMAQAGYGGDDDSGVRM